MAKIGLPKGSGKRLKVREKSVKSQGIFFNMKNCVDPDQLVSSEARSFEI